MPPFSIVKRTLFISDLHLAEERPETTARLERFLESEVPDCAALYILGDLFEYWVGDDGLDLPFPARIARMLGPAASAVPTYFMHGNRDFMVSGRFAGHTGIRLLDDPAIVTAGGERVLLMHGDTLCTGDEAYLAFRAQVRNPAWQAAALAKPVAERVAIARAMRERSEGAKDGKAASIMDVTPAAVEKAFADSGCRILVHGHTHRPARHEMRVGGETCVRWVLPDWYEGGGYLEAGPGGFRAVDLA